MKLIIHTDGGSRGNPGEGGIGVVIEEQTENGQRTLVRSFGKRIGVCTNNEAEYRAVIEALSEIISLHFQPEQISFFLDSLLVVNQLNGLYKIKNDRLRELLLSVRAKEAELHSDIEYTAVAREKNIRADKLVNDALDH